MKLSRFLLASLIGTAIGLPVSAQQSIPNWPAPAAQASIVELQALQQRLAQVEAELTQIKSQNATSTEPVPAPLVDNAVNPASIYADGKADFKPAEKSDPMSMSAKWNNGLEFSTKDKNFKVHIGGRTQVDGVWYADSPDGFAGAGGVGDQDSVNFRRARLRIDGTMYKYYDFACEYDFVNDVNDNQGLQAPSDASGNVVPVPVPTDYILLPKKCLWLGTCDLVTLSHILD